MDVVMVSGSPTSVRGYVHLRTNLSSMNAIIEVAINVTDGMVAIFFTGAKL